MEDREAHRLANWEGNLEQLVAAQKYEVMKKAILLIWMAFVVYSCSNSDREDIDDNVNQPTSDVINLPSESYNYANPDLPNHFRTGQVAQIDNTPRNNPTTNAGATLGRVLFYDLSLSANDTKSCASCHVQSSGFSDLNRFSEGFEGIETGRNSMGLTNARYYDNGRFFWDERANTLENQVLIPIQDQVEMGLSLTELVDKIQSKDYYKPLFSDAFGDATVNSDRISLSASSVCRSQWYLMSQNMMKV